MILNFTIYEDFLLLRLGNPTLPPSGQSALLSAATTVLLRSSSYGVIGAAGHDELGRMCLKAL